MFINYFSISKNGVAFAVLRDIWKHWGTIKKAKVKTVSFTEPHYIESSNYFFAS